jgi:hypothetical protein
MSTNHKTCSYPGCVAAPRAANQRLCRAHHASAQARYRGQEQLRRLGELQKIQRALRAGIRTAQRALVQLERASVHVQQAHARARAKGEPT